MSNKRAKQWQVRPAVMSDAESVRRLINAHADQGRLLPLSLSRFYSSIRDFMVVEVAGEVVASCALPLCWHALAELRSLVVAEQHRGNAYAQQLIQHHLASARLLGVKKVFALTYIPDFFYQHGFTFVEKSRLPHKIWADCVHCAKFRDCDETAVIITL